MGSHLERLGISSLDVCTLHLIPAILTEFFGLFNSKFLYYETKADVADQASPWYLNCISFSFLLLTANLLQPIFNL
jgi:hypothetical protein